MVVKGCCVQRQYVEQAKVLNFVFVLVIQYFIFDQLGLVSKSVLPVQRGLHSSLKILAMREHIGMERAVS